MMIDALTLTVYALLFLPSTVIQVDKPISLIYQPNPIFLLSVISILVEQQSCANLALRIRPPNPGGSYMAFQ